MEKLNRAEEIMTTIGSSESLTDEQYSKMKYEAMELYKSICFDSKVDLNVRVEAFNSFMWCIPEDGLDAYRRLRDTLFYAAAPSIKERLLYILKRVTNAISIGGYINEQSRKIISYEILMTATQLYNLGEMDIYDIFIKLVQDEHVSQTHKLESCKYLYSTGEDEYKKLVSSVLSNAIDGGKNPQPSSERYDLLTAYFSKKGLATAMNNSRIKIPYDEEFVSVLQKQFFNDDRNGIRERCLSGQHLLSMSPQNVSRDEKNGVVQTLLSFANNDTLSENLRADAADIVLRLGEGEQRIVARKLIKELGYSSVNKSAANIRDRIKHIYNNTQNIHFIPDECVEMFCTELMNDTQLKPQTFDEIFNEIINEKLKDVYDDRDKRLAAKDALHRIAIDTATFSSYNLTTQEIFVYVYQRIKTYDGDIRKTLEQLFYDELVDMNGWCSTGHADRFILVLQPVSSYIKFNFDEQLVANFSARMAKRMEDISDQNLKDSVTLGMIKETADEDDRKNFLLFFDENCIELKSELLTEFVSAGYITDTEFETYFEQARLKWIG